MMQVKSIKICHVLLSSEIVITVLRIEVITTNDQLEFVIHVNKIISDGKYIKDVKYSHSFDKENKVTYSAMILSYEYQELEQR
jgi:hypothetical protein